MENGVWRTVGGRRIFIKDGEDLATAMKRSGKFKNLKQEIVGYHSSRHDIDKCDDKHFGESSRGGLTYGDGIYLSTKIEDSQIYNISDERGSQKTYKVTFNPKKAIDDTEYYKIINEEYKKTDYERWPTDRKKREIMLDIF